MKDLISIIVPAYNAESTLAETLESALAQTHRELEVLVVDDGSTDGTAEVAARFTQRDSRCICIRQANTGQARALNLGIENARGEYVSFLDADDLYHPAKLELQLQELARTGRDVALTQIQRFAMADARRVELSRTVPPVWGEQEAYFRAILFLGSFQMALFTTAMVRRRVLLRLGGFDSSLPTAKDWDLWLRLAASGCTFVNVEEPLYFYRKYPGSLSLRHGIYRTLHTQWRILRKLKEKSPVSAGDLMNAERSRLFEHVRILLYRGEIGVAWRMLAEGCCSHHLYVTRNFYELAYESLRRKALSWKIAR